MKKPLRPPIERVLFILFIVASSVALTGCMNSTSGTPIDAAKVSRIEKGKTTRAEVEAMLGRPDMTMMLGDGRRCLTYSYSSSSVGTGASSLVLGPFARVSATIRSQTLQVFVGRDGVVEDYELSDGTRDLSGNALNMQSTTR